jgi:hypothetical protein
LRSDDALASLARLAREMIDHRVRTIFERRAEGDFAGILEYLAEDVVYKVQGGVDDLCLFPAGLGERRLRPDRGGDQRHVREPRLDHS